MSINSDIGDNALGQTTINISNLAANGDGGSITPDGDSGVSGGTIELQEGTQYASGNADIIGMGAAVVLNIDQEASPHLEKPVSLPLFFRTSMDWMLVSQPMTKLALT